MILNISEEDRFKIQMVLDRFNVAKFWYEIFYDLCFAICAPQTTFKSNRKVIDELIRRRLYEKIIPIEELKIIIKPVRFLRKADYILEAKNNFENIREIIKNNLNDYEKREKLVEMVKGLGYKASSHFLRNLGATDLAIIDTHIIKFMNYNHGPKSKKEYLLMEEEFRNIAKENNLSIAGLDAYIWKINSKTHWSEFKY